MRATYGSGPIGPAGLPGEPMSEPDGVIEPTDPLLREALTWVVKLTSGEATPADAEALRAWRRQSRQHDAAYRDATRLWQLSGEAACPIPLAAQPLGTPSRRPSSRRVFLRRTALAAGIAGVAAVGSFLALGPSVPALLADHRTTTGVRRRLDLPDGSVAHLNTQTALSVRFDGATRHVDLHAGEALFAVQPDARRPFTVLAAGGSITAVGTVFAVRRAGAQVVVTCVEGSIDVASGAMGALARLAAGRQIAYGPTGLERAMVADVRHETAWRDGLLMFRDEPLDHVVGELNRYRPGRIILANRELADRRVTGVFHLERLDEALRQIEHTLNLQSIGLSERLTVLY